MDDPGRVRWKRLLLVIAALVGIVAMHSMVGPSHDDTMAAPSVLSVVALPGGPGVDFHGEIAAAVTMPGASDGAPMSPMSPLSAPHALMHLCLAVIAVGIVLGLLAVALTSVAARERSFVAPAPHPDARPARPPLPTGARLAQLCVLRN